MTSINNSDQLREFIEDVTGSNKMSMLRSRPYDGQPHTTTGIRGSEEIKGITFRDLRDCYIRATMQSVGPDYPGLYAESEKGEHANLCEGDLYGLDCNIDPIAICQNMCCEIEKLMGIYPNVPMLESEDE
ncbi:MAG: hypothetical protein JRC86_04785 [Deltaproteobacteria bacterium]|nr:hypothetical protein [Deltaproteobacteria bacterium]